MKIGLDVHGVIDRFPNAIREYAINALQAGHEVHIITGQEREDVEPLVKSLGVPYSHFFSIVDYHHSIDTEMWQDAKKTWWMDSVTWKSTKGDYCERAGIDIMFDDTLSYGDYMPDTTEFVYISKEDEPFPIPESFYSVY